jgi:neutral ceramidase
MTPRYLRKDSVGASSRLALYATLSAVSLFILAVFVASNFDGAGPLNRFDQHRALRQGANGETPVSKRAGDKYLLGVGKADITGPSVEINFAGYADTAQVGSGIRQRIYSRAFIIGDVNNPSDRFVYVVQDTQGGDTAVRYGVLEALAALGSNYSMYGQSNIALTGTHSHSGPGAWFNYLLPQITSLGFSDQSYQAIVDGTVLSIQRAHESLEEVRYACDVYTSINDTRKY